MKEKVHTDFAPFFIVGFERSGTTLLATLLDRHSMIAVTPETHFFDLVLPKRRDIRDISTHAALADRLFSSRRVKDMVLEHSKLLARFKRYSPNYPSLLQATLEEYVEKQGKSIIGEKTPAHMPYVPLILRWYPNAKVICIVRDGRDAVLSLMKSPWPQKNLRLHCRMWRWCAKRTLKYEKWFPNNFTIVRFEDILLRPKETVMWIDGFLGVAFEDRQLDPSIPTDVVPQWEQQWKGKVCSELDPKRVEAWKETALPKEVWVMNSMMHSYLKYFNYSDAELQGYKTSFRLKNYILNFIYIAIYHPTIRQWLKLFKRMLKSF